MKLALAQTDIFWEDKQANKKTAEKFINQASKAQAGLILFPEMSLTGFSMKASALGEARIGDTAAFFNSMAQAFNINIGFGYVEAPPQGGKGRNNYGVVGSDGRFLTIYSKIHPFSHGRESLFYESGKSIEIYTLDNWSVSSFICYDLRFPEVFQIASRKAQLITVAANWPTSRACHWETLLRARAVENQCYIAGVNRTGCGDDIIYSGGSMVIDPYGDIITKGGNSEELLLCEIDLKEVNNIRRDFRLKDDRREALYASYYKIGDDEL